MGGYELEKQKKKSATATGDCNQRNLSGKNQIGAEDKSGILKRKVLFLANVQDLRSKSYVKC